MRGEIHPIHKLIDAEVVRIRDAYRAGSTAEALARQTELHLSTICRALTGQTWSHVPNPIEGNLYEGGSRHHNYKHGKYVVGR